jgi:small subunit ribosomal protein S9
MLDKFILDEKAEGLRYLDYNQNGDELPKAAQQDTSSFELSWAGRIFKDQDPLKPLLMDDPSRLDKMPEDTDTPYRDILDRIKYEDSRTDYSYQSLTPDQKTEIALFHSFKQDPYFKHFLHNHIRQFAEDMDEGVLNFPEGPFTKEVLDFPKFDRINLYDFRRALPQKDREAKLDSNGAAWGFGKRKTSRAVVRVKPGKGTVNINGMNMLDYFSLPSQRYRILLPLMITQYTCLLDLDIWVHGGGLTGQPEAIVPAVAKALQNYDVKTRPILKYFKLMRHDPRNVERKKYGRIKARKGQVYRRR